MREQQNKNGTCNKTNVHHDLLCFSVKRRNQGAEDRGSFRVMRREDSLTSRTRRSSFAKRHSLDNGKSKGERDGAPSDQVPETYFVIVNEKFRRYASALDFMKNTQGVLLSFLTRRQRAME